VLLLAREVAGVTGGNRLVIVPSASYTKVTIESTGYCPVNLVVLPLIPTALYVVPLSNEIYVP